MNEIISFTPKELMETIVLIWACLSAVIGMTGFIISKINKYKKPNQIQDKRLDDIEHQLESFKKMFSNDNDRIKGIERGNRVTQRALLALLSHGIDGNEIDAMSKAKEELENYLIQR